MIILHGGCKCRVVWRTSLSEYKIESGSPGVITAGHFKWCPILEQWTLIVSHDRSFTFEFTQKAWAGLWMRREMIHASSHR